MLVQSHAGSLNLLPVAWPYGRVTGLRAVADSRSISPGDAAICTTPPSLPYHIEPTPPSSFWHRTLRQPRGDSDQRRTDNQATGGGQRALALGTERQRHAVKFAVTAPSARGNTDTNAQHGSRRGYAAQLTPSLAIGKSCMKRLAIIRHHLSGVQTGC